MKTNKTQSELLAAVLAYRYKGESGAACVARIYRSGTHAVHLEAVQYVSSIKPHYLPSNPKIDLYRNEGTRADRAYIGSTNYFTTCRDAEINYRVDHPGESIRAVRASP